MVNDSGEPRAKRLLELARLFARLGTTAFGGPAAHIAMMEDEVVTRRQWLTRERFLDLLAATNLIPGPNSTEMAIHIGHARAGWAGLVVAGASFIAPAALIVTMLAYLYVTYGHVPQAAGLLYGIKPVVIGIVMQALVRLTRSALTSVQVGAIALLSAIAAFTGVNEITVLAVAGVVMVLLMTFGTGHTPDQNSNEPTSRAALMPLSPVMLLQAATAVAGNAAVPFTLGKLFLFFAKIGSVLFGSGYVLLAFLRTGLVHERGWLTESQLLDAVAIGQMIPGPVFTTATFIGYVLGGGAGAVAATLGIFLPAFFFVAVSGPLVPRIRRSKVAGAFLDGVVAASLALMAVVTIQLATAAVVDVYTTMLFAVSVLVLLKWKVNSFWLVAGGAVSGLILQQWIIA